MNTVDFRAVRVADIVTRPPFNILFPIHPDVLTEITDSIRTDGYDVAEPIVVWAEENVLVEGHTRLKAAEAAGLDIIPAVYYRSFVNESAALQYAIKAQRSRRNLTPADIFACIETISKWMERGRPSTGEIKQQFENASRDAFSEGRVADMLGVSRATVTRAKAVIEHADEETVEAVKTGEIKSIKAAYEVTQQKRADEAKPPKKLTARTQAHVAGTRYQTLIVNVVGMPADTLANLPVTRLAEASSNVYLWVGANDLGHAFGVLADWGFACETVLTICFPDSKFGRYFYGAAEFVLVGHRSKRDGRSPMKPGVIMAERNERGHPDSFYRLVLSSTPGPYLEMFPSTYRDHVSVWGEETPVDAAPADDPESDPYEGLNHKEMIRRILSDGVWRTPAEIAAMLGDDPNMVSARCRELTDSKDPDQRRFFGKVVKFRLTAG